MRKKFEAPQQTFQGASANISRRFSRHFKAPQQTIQSASNFKEDYTYINVQPDQTLIPQSIFL